MKEGGVQEVDISSRRREKRYFYDFFDKIDMEDLNPLGRKFTWFHSNGVAMSRIDRVLVLEDWELVWGVPVLWVLPRDISDHCLLLLKTGESEWGPKPFRFNNYWIVNRKFKKVVEEDWRADGVTGWIGVVLRNKLRRLKDSLRLWSKEEYGRVEDQIVGLKADIEELDLKGEEGTLTSLEVDIRKSKFEELWKLLKSKESSLVQRSKTKWLKEGDENSKFFHRSVKLRANQNSIRALQVEGGWVQTPEEVRGEVVEYFKRQVASPCWERPRLDGVNFGMLSEEENRNLIAPFSMEKIERVVKESNGNKSPGPNGFNFAFIKEF